MRFIDWLRRAAGRDRGAQAAQPTTEPARQTEHASQLVDRGNGLQARGDLDGALREYLAAAAIAPHFGRPRLNIGNVMMARGDFAAAVDAFETALRIQPHYPGAHFNLGNAHQAAGELELARLSYERALAQDASFVNAMIARASVLDDLQRLGEAAAAYRDALGLAPEMAEVRVDLAYVLARQGKVAEALDECRRAIATNPASPKALALEAGLLKDAGRLDEAVARYERLLQADPDSPSLLSSLLFTSNYRADRPDPRLLALAERYGEVVRRRARPFHHWDNDPSGDRVLRVGFVSGDLREHPVAYFLEGVVAALADQVPRRLELIAYSSHPVVDAVTARLKGRFDAWRAVGNLSDEALAELVRKDRVDILIDLAGHTSHSRLPMFAWKPAPVQVSWLGYFATTGVDAIDYFIADPWTLPPGEEGDFVEKIWRLPRTRLCFTPPGEEVDEGALPALAGGVVTFGCFNHVTKIGETNVAAWSRILEAVPGSRLFLKSPPLLDAATRESMLARFASHGIDGTRVITEGLSPRRQYLEAYRRVDIALDPFPYPGGTTSAEALWMGVPVLTMRGRRFLARQGSGFLSTLGLDDWIADDDDHYVRIAVRKAADLDGLSTLRRELRRRALASPLFDATAFAADFSDALQAMWEQWSRRE